MFRQAEYPQIDILFCIFLNYVRLFIAKYFALRIFDIFLFHAPYLFIIAQISGIVYRFFQINSCGNDADYDIIYLNYDYIKKTLWNISRKTGGRF